MALNSTVLLADANALHSDRIKNWLTQNGYGFLHLTSNEALFKLFLYVDVDVILIDLDGDISVLNPYKVIASFRSQAHTDHIPIIGYGMPSDGVKILGVDFYMEKPIDLSLLKNMI